MGTLKKLKLAMKTDHNLRKLLVRGSRNEILLDINEDKEAEIALQDINNDGNIDRIALDVTGDGWFDLYIDDNDANGIPDRIFIVREGNDEEPDKVEELAAGPEVEEHIIAAAQRVALVLQAKEIIAEELDQRLKELDIRVREARKHINARM